MNRRDALKLTAAAMAGSSILACSSTEKNSGLVKFSEKLGRAAQKPVLRRELISDPVIIHSVTLLKRNKEYIVRVTDNEGIQGLALCNRSRVHAVWPMILEMVAPVFTGRDARELDQLVDDVFITSPNYKFQGLAFWVCVAWVEFAVLDLLGKRAGVSVSDLLGPPVRNRVGLYHANGDRKHSASWVLDKLDSLVAESGAKAVKFKLGARMHFTPESTARDKLLIPRVREKFGDDTTLYADANSSYDVAMSLYIGRMLEEYQYGFFEEPVQFDHLEETRQVSASLDLPIAGGEQESSLWRFRWLIENSALQVIQPDLVYFGGLIRSMRVARMAELAGIPCVPHISGLGLGQLYMAHFVGALPNTTDFQEYKSDKDKVPYVMRETGKRYKAKDGFINVPRTAGLGVEFDPAYIASMQQVKI